MSTECVERLLAFRNVVGADELVFTGDPLIGDLLHDDPFAFLLAASLDRGMKAERASRLPAKIRDVLGHLDPARIAAMSEDEVLAMLKRIEGKPHYITDAARTIIQVARTVTADYAGNARNLWSGQTAAEIKSRLMEFHGVASGIASMVVNLLATLKENEFTPDDYVRMDVKPDSQLRRVFKRLGFCDPGATDRQVVDAARQLNPSYPGALDAPAWHIGRKWCHATQPDCPGCPLLAVCPQRL